MFRVFLELSPDVAPEFYTRVIPFRVHFLRMKRCQTPIPFYALPATPRRVVQSKLLILTVSSGPVSRPI